MAATFAQLARTSATLGSKRLSMRAVSLPCSCPRCALMDSFRGLLFMQLLLVCKQAIESARNPSNVHSSRIVRYGTNSQEEHHLQIPRAILSALSRLHQLAKRSRSNTRAMIRQRAQNQSARMPRLSSYATGCCECADSIVAG